MKFVAYYRVSTKQQGLSGLGLDAQKSVVLNYISVQQGALIKDFTEIESGGKNNRKMLNEALTYCQLTNATLLIAKLDRLSRDAHFLTGLMKSKINFICCDQPHANQLTIGLLAILAEHERKICSERTKAALAAAKRRGIRLGNPRIHEISNQDTAPARAQYIMNTQTFYEQLAPVINDIKTKGITSYLGIAKYLNELGFQSRRGGKFYASTVKLIILGS